MQKYPVSIDVRVHDVALLNILTQYCITFSYIWSYQFLFIYNILQSNPLKWIAQGPNHEYPLRHSIHLSMFYTLHFV